MIKYIKNNYKIFLVSVIIWFIIIGIWGYLNNNYKIFEYISKRYLSKVSKDFILTTALGIVTTILSSIYQYLKGKAQKNEEEIEKSKRYVEITKENTLQAVRRLEDLIDQQTFELRRLDDFNMMLTAIRTSTHNLENKIVDIKLELERQKEQLIQSDKVLRLSTLLREDIREREVLKLEMKQIIENFINKKSDG